LWRKSFVTFALELVEEELRYQRFFVGQRREAFTDVAGWEYAELVYQFAGGAGVVGYGYHGGQRLQVDNAFAVAVHVFAYPAQEGREAGPAANSHYSEVL